MASASPMFCEAPVTTARASGLGAGTGMGRTISWAIMRRSAAARAAATAVAGPGLGAVGLRRDGRERDRRDLRVLGLSDQRGRRRPTRRDDTAELAVPGAGVVRLGGGRCSPRVTGVWVDAPWRRRRVLARADRGGGGADRVDEPDPRRLPLSVARACSARCTAACSELATVPYNAMLRQLSTPQTLRPDIRIRFGRWAISAACCCCSSSTSGSSPATATPADCWASRPPTARTCGRRCC